MWFTSTRPTSRNLAALLATRGQYSEAEELYWEALAMAVYTRLHYLTYLLSYLFEISLLPSG